MGGFYVNVTTFYGDGKLRGPAGHIANGEVMDNFHPNTLGHAKIASRILAVAMPTPER
ncbi:hypothetical protein GCWB2_05705 [Gordonia rubripertincta]|nr:hypothetical protein GCWB2_05705 [Gordonia rubripertincta]